MTEGKTATIKKLTKLTKDNAQSLKGLAAIMVLVCHLAQPLSFGNRYLSVLLSSLGYLSCAVFFFLSGYGLELSFSDKRYSKGFFSWKVLPYVVIYLCIAALYYLYHIVWGDDISLRLLIRTLTFGDSFISNGWYLQVQFFLYLMFWIVFSLFPNRKTRLIIIAALVASYCAVLFYLDIASFWYNSVMAFPIGCCCAGSKERKILINPVIACAAVFLLSYSLTYFMGNGVWRTVMYIVSSNIFAMLLYMLFADERLSFITTRLKIAGNYSFGIYVMQGIPLDLFQRTVFDGKRSFAYALCVIITTALLSIPFTAFQKRIYNVFRNKYKTE